MIQRLVSVLLFSFCLIGVNPSASADFDQQHLLWTRILSKNVSSNGATSTVDYISLKRHPELLKTYLDQLSGVTEAEFSRWTKNSRLAFLINAYNAWTIQLVIDHYPIKSIKDIGGIFSSPWKKKIVKLFGQTKTLDWLEHEKIRPEYEEARVHFALVCAAKGCPGLRSEAFTPENLTTQLNHSARLFLNDSARNSIHLEKSEMSLSPIFKWYKDDFVRVKGSIEQFVLAYVSTPDPSIPHFKITYKDYDWSLNVK